MRFERTEGRVGLYPVGRIVAVSPIHYKRLTKQKEHIIRDVEAGIIPFISSPDVIQEYLATAVLGFSPLHPITYTDVPELFIDLKGEEEEIQVLVDLFFIDMHYPILLDVRVKE